MESEIKPNGSEQLQERRGGLIISSFLVTGEDFAKHRPPSLSNQLGLCPDSHFSFDSANHRVASDAFIYAGWKALKALRRSTPNG